MKYKLMFTSIALLFTSCVNIASPVTTVTVIKTQMGGEESEMSGANLEKVAEGVTQRAGNIKLPGK